MSKRWFLLVIFLIVALPSALYASDMGAFGEGTVGIINIQTKIVGKVVYSHKIHGNQCKTCHPKIFKKKNNSNHATMVDMGKGKSCGACHDGSTAFSVAGTGDCDKCHAGDITFTDENVGNIIFPHSVHIEALDGCDSCHPDLFKAERGANKATMKDMGEGQSCGACHDGSTAFSVAGTGDCDKCHAGDITFTDENVGNITFPHSVHIEALDGCDSCHPDLFKAERGSNKATMKDMGEGQSCGACHDGSTAFSVAGTGDCDKCHAGDILFKDEENGNVTFPHSVHIEALEGCDSCHPDLFKAERGANKATMEDMEGGASCGACHDGSTAFNVAEDCESCHDM